jgi:hypothetical protein
MRGGSYRRSVATRRDTWLCSKLHAGGGHRSVAIGPTANRRMAKIHVKMLVKPLWKKGIFPAMAQSNN